MCSGGNCYNLQELKNECVTFYLLSCSKAKSLGERQQSFDAISESEEEKRIEQGKIRGEGHKRNLQMGGTQYYRVPGKHKETARLKQKAPTTEDKQQGHRQGQLLSGGEKAPEGN